MVESFHRSGIVFNMMDWLKRLHMALMPNGPKCRRLSYARLSGPLALELPTCLMASVTCAGLNNDQGDPDPIQFYGAGAAHVGWKERGADD